MIWRRFDTEVFGRLPVQIAWLAFDSRLRASEKNHQGNSVKIHMGQATSHERCGNARNSSAFTLVPSPSPSSRFSRRCFAHAYAQQTSAYRIKCTSNLHQLGLAAQMYWDDNGTVSVVPSRPTAGSTLVWLDGPGRRSAADATGALPLPQSRRGHIPTTRSASSN